MKYAEYLNTPHIHQEFNNMFEKQRDYYRTKNKSLGIETVAAELFSIKIAFVMTDIHFTGKFYEELKNKN